MAKKKGAAKAAKNPPTQCQLAGEIEVDQYGAQPVAMTDQLEWSLLYCNSPIDVLLYLKDLETGTRQKLLDEHQPAANPLRLRIQPPQRAGRYRLEWDFIVVGTWQVVAAVDLNGVTVYRKYKAHDSKHPRTFLMLDLVVSCGVNDYYLF
jgi:hypothetical protein